MENSTSIIIGIGIIALLIIVGVGWYTSSSTDPLMSEYIMREPSTDADKALIEVMSDKLYINSQLKGYMSFKYRAPSDMLWTFYSPSQMKWKAIGTIVLPCNIIYGENPRFELIDGAKMFIVKPIDRSDLIEVSEYYHTRGRYKRLHLMYLIATE